MKKAAKCDSCQMRSVIGQCLQRVRLREINATKSL